MAICKLCSKEKKLIKSHIIPKGFFDFLYPDKFDDPKRVPLSIVSTNDEYEKKSPVGIYDNGILCAECDNKIGVFDDYAQKIFLKQRPSDYPGSSEALMLINIDCGKIKMFFISLLWRASISGREEFKLINLGPLEAILKRALEDNDPMMKNDFSVISCRFGSDKLPQITNKIIQTPFCQRIDQINFSVFYLGNGYKFFIKVDSRRLIDGFEQIALDNNDDKIIILKLREYTETPEFKLMLNVV